jgi:hypothetical protein
MSHASRTVYLTEGFCSKTLTRALRNPDDINLPTNFAFNSIRGAIVSNKHTSAVPIQTLCFRKILAKSLAIAWFFLSLVLSMAMGCGAGFGKHDAGFGITVGSVSLAVATMLQGVLLWHGGPMGL